MAKTNLNILEGDPVLSKSEELLDICIKAFNTFDRHYLTERLVFARHLSMVEARSEAGALTGFKLGYSRGRLLYYSWLGAVHPRWQGQGIATALLKHQHAWAHSCGYSQIETRTRTENAAMIILNLKSGFVIKGFETDRNGSGVITQRKILG